MKNRKMNLDRPPLDSKEIQAGMNFGQLMISYQAMSKPFYKSKWFFGTAGMASIGLIVGGTFAFQSENETLETQKLPITDAPPVINLHEPKEDELMAMNYAETPALEAPEKTEFDNQKVTKHDKKDTPVILPEPLAQSNDPIMDQEKKADQPSDSGFDPIDLTPRINGKMNGDITREDLLDNKGLTTNADISIIHFELHLIDGLGGKVFEEESNQLNLEMKNALKNVGKGETIFFENIKGKTPDGQIVRLNPLRYVLLN